ncbi:MAG: FmdE family protein [Thermoleophilia bacterium]|jgi:formylmethanofuran dehydrogenase subunit E
MDTSQYPGLDDLIAFHGHLCPGLAIGYRATAAAIERLDVERARDEELVAIVENDSCSVDAVQYLAGATFGKGNFFFRDWGKQVITLGRRGQPRAVRVSLKWGALNASPEQEAIAKKMKSGKASQAQQDQAAGWRQEKIDYILNAPASDLFEIREVEIELPPEARIIHSVKCGRCGEPVMETRTFSQDETTLCTQCRQNG